MILSYQRSFYQELFGLRAVTDFEENVILSEGLVLEEKEWLKYDSYNI
ncbi:MAG: hypothetical protein IJA10_07095 [Lachnospiraceae bacterium]|nr:hypothetical protein [Lachnospiraceae bacterium]